MSKGIKYTIFQTEWGYFGLAGMKNQLFRTCLPVSSRKKAQKILLNDIDAEFQADLMPGLQKKINSYYKGNYVDFSKIYVCLDNYSSFTQRVLAACQKIEYGRTITYGQLAKKALSIIEKGGIPARAVGSIMAKNPIPLIIPCHRVIRSDGKIGGFSAAGGPEIKEKMLIFEQKKKR